VDIDDVELEADELDGKIDIKMTRQYTIGRMR
jgi:hypothetical protein